MLEKRRAARGPRGSLVLLGGSDLATVENLSSTLSRGAFDVLIAFGPSQLESRAREFSPDVIVLDLTARFEADVETCKRLSKNARTGHIPILGVMHTPPTDSDELLDCLHDFVLGPFEPDELKARVRMTLGASGRNRSLNPLTGLPGNPAIQQELSERVTAAEEVALMHIDIDDFKAFNDHYGFMRGDEAIKLLTRCITEALDEVSPQNGFVGHVGGDDFAAVVPAREAEAIAQAIVDRWDGRIEALYDPEDIQGGFLEVPDRRGYMNRFPLMGVSIGVATTATRPIRTHWEASQIAAEMKHVAKSQDHSTVAIDRRRELSDPGPERTPQLVS
jgi:diguanylate cyclase (GGDEF)-like protein